jgi:hypothetical protein
MTPQKDRAERHAAALVYCGMGIGMWVGSWVDMVSSHWLSFALSYPLGISALWLVSDREK